MMKLSLLVLSVVSSLILVLVCKCILVCGCCVCKWVIVWGRRLLVIVGRVFICMIGVDVFVDFISVVVVDFSVCVMFIVCCKNCLLVVVSCVFCWLCFMSCIFVSVFSLLSVFDIVGWFRCNCLVVCCRLCFCVMVIK